MICRGQICGQQLFVLSPVPSQLRLLIAYWRHTHFVSITSPPLLMFLLPRLRGKALLDPDSMPCVQPCSGNTTILPNRVDQFKT